MKRIISIILTLACAAALLTGCGSSFSSGSVAARRTDFRQENGK